MGKAHQSAITEGFLGLFCGRGRAREIVGDLNELAVSGSASFWPAYLGTLIRFTWRWLVAIPIAAISLLYGVTHGTSHLIILPGSRITKAHGIFWLLAAACIGSAVILNAIRFGLRNRLNAIGCTLVLLLTIIAFHQQQPVIMHGAIAALLVLFIACLVLPSLRAALFSVSAAAGGFAGIFILQMYLVVLTIPFHSQPFMFTATAFFASLAFSFTIEAAVLAATHRFLLRGTPAA